MTEEELNNLHKQVNIRSTSLMGDFQQLLLSLAERRESTGRIAQNASELGEHFQCQFECGRIEENRMISYMIDNVMEQWRKRNPVIIKED